MSELQTGRFSSWANELQSHTVIIDVKRHHLYGSIPFTTDGALTDVQAAHSVDTNGPSEQDVMQAFELSLDNKPKGTSALCMGGCSAHGIQKKSQTSICLTTEQQKLNL